MRCMIRHQTEIWYANYSKAEPIIDDYGNDTGEKKLTYGTPERVMAHVSSARGTTEIRQFGEALDYDRVVVLDNPNVPITEYSILWIDTPYGQNVPHDYVVRGIARSANFVSIAVKKVVVS